MKSILTLLLSFTICMGIYANNEAPLPDSVQKVYTKLIKKWNKKLHLRPGQKDIFWELLSHRYEDIVAVEQKYGNDRKMIYKECRGMNAKFFDNVKDMMTAKQWHLWELWLKKYLEKKKRKTDGRELSYHELWKY